MDDKSPNVSQLIKKYRLINQIRQEDMSLKIGVSRATLINYEKGHTNIPFDFLDKIKSQYPDFNEFLSEKSPTNKNLLVADGFLDLKLILEIIFKKNKNYIFKWMIFFGFIGLCGSLFITNYYSAGISLFPADSKQSTSSQLQAIALTAGFNIAQNEQSYNITDVAKSRRIAEKVISNKWKNINSDNNNLVEFWNLSKIGMISKILKVKKTKEDLLNSGIKKYFSLLKINEDRRTGLIRVDIEMESPKLAAEVANFIGFEIQKYVQKQNAEKAVKEKLFIKDRLSVVKKELEMLEENLKDFKERNRGFEASPELYMVHSQKLREVQAKQQVYVTLQQQLELARINEVKQTPIINILDDAIPPVSKSRPNRFIILILSIFAGFLFGSAISIIKY